ncbi:MAG: proliferating cell nuclear antigen (pcna) [Nanoarchaeota archaeon]
MLLKLDNPKILSDIVGIISELVTEVRIKVNKSGLSMIAIDPANVALVSFKLPAGNFSAFEAEEEVLGVSFDSLKSVLRRAGAGSSLILQTQDNTLKVEIHDKIKRTFKLALINIDEEEKSMPSLDFVCDVEMPTMDFSEAIEDCSVVADSCIFSINDGKFVVEARGLHSTKSEFSGDEAKISGEKGKAKYSLEYMQKFARACKLTDKVSVNFSDDYPLKLEFKSNNFELAFVLAPRVESED